MSETVVAADLFCGAGGTSTGLVQACEATGKSVDLTAINHWNIAVETHAANHPWARHLCESLDNLNPRHVMRGRQLDLLVASPECTHHSNARGGKPCSDQSRSTAWHVLRWAEALNPLAILVENVKEFASWGPLIQKRDKKGALVFRKDGTPYMVPDPERKGELFQAWIHCLRSLGYFVNYGTVCCADYGDATTRERLFVMAKRTEMPGFPGHTHAENPGEEQLPWVPARSIIDWEFPSQSIFSRTRPLQPKTVAKIVAGLEKFGGKAAEPFLVLLRGTSMTRGVDKPLPTVTAGGGHFGLVEPFVIGQQSGSAPRSTACPLPTVAAKGAISLVEPFLLHYYGGKAGEGRVSSTGKPLPTATAGGNRFALVEPFILGTAHGGQLRDLGTPLSTITTKNQHCLIEPFLVEYYGKGKPHSVTAPLPTVVTKDRFGLVEAVGFDIHFRMLQPHELAAAMSFPQGYRFEGTKTDTVRQIGNAVPVQTARELCARLLA